MLLLFLLLLILFFFVDIFHNIPYKTYVVFSSSNCLSRLNNYLFLLILFLSLFLVFLNGFQFRYWWVSCWTFNTCFEIYFVTLLQGILLDWYLSIWIYSWRFIRIGFSLYMHNLSGCRWLVWVFRVEFGLL